MRTNDAAQERVLARALGGVGRALGGVAIIALVVLAVGDAVGRWRVLPSPPHTAGTAYARSDLVVVVPVPVFRLTKGDVVAVHNRQEHALYRIRGIVDSTGAVRFAGDAPGRVRRLHGTAWRVRAAVPWIGTAMALLTGPIQGLACMGIGLLLIVYAEVRRSRELRGVVVVPHPAT